MALRRLERWRHAIYAGAQQCCAPMSAAVPRLMTELHKGCSSVTAGYQMYSATQKTTDFIETKVNSCTPVSYSCKLRCVCCQAQFSLVVCTRGLQHCLLQMLRREGWNQCISTETSGHSWNRVPHFKQRG
jgi:hypothetical protein